MAGYQQSTETVGSTDSQDANEPKATVGSTGSTDPEKASPAPGLALSPDRVLLEQSTQAGEWSGPDDPDDPQNWGIWKKTYHSMIPSIFCFTVTLGSSLYTPGVPDVMARFDVSTTAALLGLSIFILGIAFGPMIGAPMSETLGRRVVYWLTLPVFGLFTLGAGCAQNFATLLVCRFLAGVFGSPALSIGAGTNADLFHPSARATSIGLFVLAPSLGPALGPVIGGFVAENKGWRWTQWTLLFFTVASYVFSAFMSETYKKTILERRAKRLGVSVPKTGPTGAAALKFLLTVTLFRPLSMLITEPIVGFFSLYVAFNFAVVFAFFDAFPIVFEGVYKFNLGQVGLTFLGLALGCCVAVVTFILVDRFTYQKYYRASLQEGRNGVVAPEHRLYPAMLGSVGLPVGLFWFGWTARADVHWISPVLAALPFGWGNLLVFCSVALYLIDVYDALNGASALAANGLLRYVLGAAFPLFTVQMYRRLGIDWATSLFGFIALALMLLPWIVYKWGPQIRRRSKYDTIKV